MGWNSPARNGGCGLKPVCAAAQFAGAENSPARNGGCGLKQLVPPSIIFRPHNSPARNGGCGLKQIPVPLCCRPSQQFTRQKWRVWIETRCRSRPIRLGYGNSPARNGGCGLKLLLRCQVKHCIANSPARNGGCGLKLLSLVFPVVTTCKFTRQKWRVWIETGQGLHLM